MDRPTHSPTKNIVQKYDSTQTNQKIKNKIRTAMKPICWVFTRKKKKYIWTKMITHSIITWSQPVQKEKLISNLV